MARLTRTDIGILLTILSIGIQGCAMYGQQKPPTDPLKLRESAINDYKEGRYDAAIVEFGVLVNMLPKDGDLWFRLANSYARAGRPDKAIESYRNALLREPELGKAWYNLGVIHLQEALNAFITMGKYVPADSPMAEVVSKKRQVLFDLLQENRTTDK
jgi:tetratricopeptide (TPR) repeat protein